MIEFIALGIVAIGLTGFIIWCDWYAGEDMRRAKRKWKAAREKRQKEINAMFDRYEGKK